MCKHPRFSTALPVPTVACFRPLAILTRMEWFWIVVLIHCFLMANNAPSLSIHTFATCQSSEKRLLTSFASSWHLCAELHESCVCERFVCTFVCVSCACLVPTEARMGFQSFRLEIPSILSHVDAGTQAQLLWKSHLSSPKPPMTFLLFRINSLSDTRLPGSFSRLLGSLFPTVILSCYSNSF